MVIQNAKTKVSQNCIDLVVEFERCHLVAYLCPSKVWTIGFGHTGPEVKEGTRCTQEQADHWLRTDLTRAENTIKAYVNVPLKQHEFDALASFIFNVGRGAFVSSSVLKYVNSPVLKSKVPERMKLYNKGGPPGKLVVLPGLVRRRIWESNLYTEGRVYGPKK